MSPPPAASPWTAAPEQRTTTIQPDNNLSLDDTSSAVQEPSLRKFFEKQGR
ncbi:hypothetical protein ABH537_03480 [Escherichia coli]